MKVNKIFKIKEGYYYIYSEIQCMKQKRQTFNVNINNEDRSIIDKLQNKHSLNISNFLRLALKKKLEELESQEQK